MHSLLKVTQVNLDLKSPQRLFHSPLEKYYSIQDATVVPPLIPDSSSRRYHWEPIS